MRKLKTKPDLTTGPILKKIMLVAIPIMSTSFIQMAYNLFDTMWIGRVGYEAMTAVATAGFYLWISMSFVKLARTGAEIGVSQSLGAGDELKARDYARNALQLSLIFAFSYMIFLLLFRDGLIGFFDVPNLIINQGAIKYLSIIAFSIPFAFTNLLFDGIYNSSANSKISFIFNFIGLVINIVLDPILILGLFGMPRLEIAGAAIATVFAQIIVTLMFVYHIKSSRSPFSEFHFFRSMDMDLIKKIVIYGWPVAVQNMSFAFFAMLIGKQMSFFGDKPMGVQRVGAQIESITWMTAQGFGSALVAFVGQNYGANKIDRVKEGYFKSLKLMFAWGLLTTVILWFFATPIYQLFTSEREMIVIGTNYLKIIALSQIFMVLEIATNGAFNGIGMTFQPAMVGFVFTGLRVPFAYVLSRYTPLGLDGIWWTLSFSSIIKGIIVFALFMKVIKEKLDSEQQIQVE